MSNIVFIRIEKSFKLVEADDLLDKDHKVLDQLKLFKSLLDLEGIDTYISGDKGGIIKQTEQNIKDVSTQINYLNHQVEKLDDLTKCNWKCVKGKNEVSDDPSEFVKRLLTVVDDDASEKLKESLLSKDGKKAKIKNKKKSTKKKENHKYIIKI